MLHYSKNKRGLALSERSESKGFTLVELLVSISIVAVILTVIILNQVTYTDSIALANLADEISSTISQTQVYGIGVKGLSNDFSASFGVTFSIRSSPNGDNKTYLNFADKGGNLYVYDGNWNCTHIECLGKVDITRGNYLDKITIVRDPGAEISNNVGRVDISFARPSTEANINFFTDSGSSYAPSNVIGAQLDFKSPRGAIRSVTVYKTGQVSVQ